MTVNQAAFFSVQPNLIETSLTLRDYAPSVRQCYFTMERKLRFFHSYTRQNCELECLSNFTLNECGCVTHAVPSTAAILPFYNFKAYTLFHAVYKDSSNFSTFRISKNESLWNAKASVRYARRKDAVFKWCCKPMQLLTQLCNTNVCDRTESR